MLYYLHDSPIISQHTYYPSLTSFLLTCKLPELSKWWLPLSCCIIFTMFYTAKVPLRHPVFLCILTADFIYKNWNLMWVKKRNDQEEKYKIIWREIKEALNKERDELFLCTRRHNIVAIDSLKIVLPNWWNNGEKTIILWVNMKRLFMKFGNIEIPQEVWPLWAEPGWGCINYR